MQTAGEFAPRRREFVFYFDKETKLITQSTAVFYENETDVLAMYAVEYFYDVKVEDVFDVTLIDNIYGCEDRIDLEIVVGYNTAEQKTYPFVTTADSVIYAMINGETYLMYTDPESQNEVSTLEAFKGEKSLTLYAKLLEFG